MAPTSGSGSTAVQDRRFYTTGQSIFHAGQDASHAYLIQSGCVKIYMDSDGREYQLAKLGPGQIFGEMALLLDEPRSANAVAVEDTNLILISRGAFSQLLANSDVTIQAAMKMLMRRLRNANSSLTQEESRLEGMVEGVHRLYQSVYKALPSDEARETMTERVYPHLDKFLDAIEDFVTDASLD